MFDLKAWISKVTNWISNRGYAYTGYGTAVDITSYTSGNPYTVPSDGLFQAWCTYRQSNYVQAYVNGEVVMQVSTTGNTGMVGNILQCVPVFKGQKIYAVKSSNYSSAYFIPFTGGQ